MKNLLLSILTILFLFSKEDNLNIFNVLRVDALTHTKSYEYVAEGCTKSTKGILKKQETKSFVNKMPKELKNRFKTNSENSVLAPKEYLQTKVTVHVNVFYKKLGRSETIRKQSFYKNWKKSDTESFQPMEDGGFVTSRSNQTDISTRVSFEEPEWDNYNSSYYQRVLIDINYDGRYPFSNQFSDVGFIFYKPRNGGIKITRMFFKARKLNDNVEVKIKVTYKNMPSKRELLSERPLDMYRD